MDQRSCSTPGCGKPHRAKGLCSTHYNQANVKAVEAICVACGVAVVKTNQWARARYRSVCSMACRSYLQHGPAMCAVPGAHPSRSTQVPMDHPSRVRILCAVPPSHASRRPRPAVTFHAGMCHECGSGFIVVGNTVGSASRYCSKACSRRQAKRTRRAREHGATGTFTWDGFMRLALSLGNVCAYCDGDNNGQPFEPDHVVPLSRHGHNGLANILPACRRCNGDKRNLLVHEWAVDRESRGLPPVRYDVDRFAHLTAHDHALAAA